MKHLTQAESLNIDRSILENGFIGIEREAHRLREGKISKKRHPELLGHKLTNRFITTDFAESQIEFITPPFLEKNHVIEFLDDLNYFFYQNVNESLWPYSMPPFIEKEENIVLADFGDTNEGIFKNIYRKGLSNRYGKYMQCISGIHFNYSFSENIFAYLAETHGLVNDQKFKSDIYFKTIRNINRYNWLLLYLFGASPIVSKNFEEIKELAERHRDSYYLPNATSLRMSEVGYQSTNQAEIFVSLDCLEGYCRDLHAMTEMPFEQYKKLQSQCNEEYTQLNQNILQIEAEYYTSCRPKPHSLKGSRLTTELYNQGVHYIELRSIDLDPFSMTGIDQSTLEFLEIFMIFCCLEESPLISRKDMKEIKNNDLSVAKNGRQPDLAISNNNKKITLKDSGIRVLERMSEISDLLGHDDSLIENYLSQIQDPNLTLSGRFLDQFKEFDGGLDEIGSKVAKMNREHYLQNDYHISSNQGLINDEVKLSFIKAEDIDQTKNFDNYIKSYFKS